VTPTEVAMLVQEILDTDQIEIDDNFFDVGGNSLLALTLISKIKERSGAALSLTSVISNPTPEGLAQLIAEARPDHAGAGPVASGGGA
jgi:acyl carrier protein